MYGVKAIVIEKYGHCIRQEFRNPFGDHCFSTT